MASHPGDLGARRFLGRSALLDSALSAPTWSSPRLWALVIHTLVRTRRCPDHRLIDVAGNGADHAARNTARFGRHRYRTCAATWPPAEHVRDREHHLLARMPERRHPRCPFRSTSSDPLALPRIVSSFEPVVCRRLLGVRTSREGTCAPWPSRPVAQISVRPGAASALVYQPIPDPEGAGSDPHRFA